MRARLNSYFSPDVDDLESFRPAKPDDYGYLLTLYVGADDDQPGEEVFYIVVCTPEWLRARYASDDLVIGHQYLIVFDYGFTKIENFIREYVESCEAPSWTELMRRVGMLGSWEFEGDRVLERHRARIRPR